MALFKSPHKGFRQNVRKYVPERHPATGEVIGVKQRPLVAEFGIFGAEQPFTNPETGEQVMVADIRGGFYDTAQAAVQNGWTDEEHDAVVATLRFYCERRPDLVSEVKPTFIPAPLPWATYDSGEVEDLVMIAQAAELVPEAIRYERENLRRVAVLEPLIEALKELPEGEQRRAEPQEGFAPGALDAALPHGVAIGRAPAINKDGAVIGSPGLTDNEPVNTSSITL